MINNRSRKSKAPVEQMQQYGFNASKGIDTTASADNPNKVLLLKNLEIEPDGSLKLRKPLIPRHTLPEVVVENEIIPTTVICSKYMYDNKHMFIVRKAEDGTQYVGIYEGNVPKNFQLTIQSWYDYTEHILYPYAQDASGFINLPYLDFTEVNLENSSNNTIITGVRVNIAHPYFKITEYSEYAEATELYMPTLYELAEEVWKYRTLNFTSPEYISNHFDCKIFTPAVTELEPSENVPLDINLDTDNPYAIRDSYGLSIAALENVIPYVPVVDRGTKAEIIPNFENLPTEEFTALKDVYVSLDKRVYPFEYSGAHDVLENVRLNLLTYATFIDMPNDPDGLYLKIYYAKDCFPDSGKTPTDFFIHKSAMTGKFDLSNEDLGWVRPYVCCFTNGDSVYAQNLKTGDSYYYEIHTNIDAYGTAFETKYTPDGYLEYIIWKVELPTYNVSDEYLTSIPFTIKSSDWAKILKNKYMHNVSNTRLFEQVGTLKGADIRSYLRPASKGSTRYVAIDYPSVQAYGIQPDFDNNMFRYSASLYDNGTRFVNDTVQWYRILTVNP